MELVGWLSVDVLRPILKPSLARREGADSREKEADARYSQYNARKIGSPHAKKTRDYSFCARNGERRAGGKKVTISGKRRWAN